MTVAIDESSNQQADQRFLHITSYSYTIDNLLSHVITTRLFPTKTMK